MNAILSLLGFLGLAILCAIPSWLVLNGLSMIMFGIPGPDASDAFFIGIMIATIATL